MSRIYNPESAGKDRNRLTRAIAIALRELMHQTEPNLAAKDLAAFIALALRSIADTIDPSVAAWEKRGYWVKADRFRMDWAWTSKFADQMAQATMAEDWGSIAATTVQIAQKLQNIKIPANHRLGAPWTGSWQKLKEISQTK